MLTLKLASCARRSLCQIQLSCNKGLERTLCTAAVQKADSSDWQPIYKFNYIEFLASLNKLKMYQVIATGITIPASFAIPEIEGMEQLPAITTAVGVTGILTLSIASYAFKGTVGFIYINSKNPDLVKIAYLDFWGIRKDIEMRLDEIVPFSEIPKSYMDRFYTKLHFNSAHPRLKLFHRFGGIIDHVEFTRIFGYE